MEVIRKLSIIASKHIDFGIYGSDTRFMFKDSAGRSYIEGRDFDNGEFTGRITEEEGSLYFSLVPVAADMA